MVKKDRNSDIQKREICLTNFEKGTLIGAIIVISTGPVAYGQISKVIFCAFQLSPVNFYAQGFSRK